MDRDGARWIEELPAGLAAQQGLLLESRLPGHRLLGHRLPGHRCRCRPSRSASGPSWAGAHLPDGIEETASDLDLGRLLAAGVRVAELLGKASGELSEEQRAVLPSAMGRFVLSDLRAAATT